jgi:outer membrane protein assembly factor BamB
MGGQVIELGLDRDPPRLDRPEAVLVRRRRIGAGAVTIVAALVLTVGSAPAAPPPPEVRIAAGPGDAIALSADRLYVLPSGTTWSVGPRTVAAYDLPAGRRLWREPLPVEGQVRQVVPAPSALLVVVERDALLETAAIDASSGRVRWRARLEPVGLAAGGRLLIGFARSAGGDPHGGRVIALDLVTGRPAWEYEVPVDAWHGMEWSAQQWSADDRTAAGPRSVTAWPAGRIAVRDLETGRVVATADPGGPPTGNNWFQLAGDLLLAGVIVDGQDVVTAYGLPALDRRWTVTTSLTGGYVSADCGGALCFFAGNGGLRVVDPATGATRWSDDRWQTVETVGGRLLAYAWPAASRATTALLDPISGGELLDLGRWTALEPVTSGGRTRAVRLDAASGRAWFAVVDVEALQVRVVFSAPGISGDCQAGERVVVCRRLDASFGVWRFS